MPEPVRSAYTAGVQAMLGWEPSGDGSGCHALTLAPGALEVWREYRDAIERHMRPDGRLEHHTGWASKAPGAALRLAGVLHAVRYAHAEPWREPITAPTVETALEILAVVLEHSLAVLDAMGADPDMADARAVLRWLVERQIEASTVREIFNALKHRMSKTERVRRALAVLEERGHVRIVEPEPNPAGGRPRSPTVLVRPELVGAGR